MANGKKYVVELVPTMITDVLVAFEALCVSVERSISKETDLDVKEARMKQLHRLRATRDQIAYGGKEVV